MIYKRFDGKRLKGPKDKNWSKGRWYVWKRLNGRIIHKAIPEARTEKQALQAEIKIIEQAFNKRYGIADTSATFAKFSETYEKYCRQKNKNITAKLQYISILKDFFKGRLLSEITPQECRDAQYHFQKRKKKGGGTLAPSSVNRIMTTLSKLLTLACEEGLLDRNPMQHVRLLEEPEKRKRLLTKGEKESLWKELQKDELMSQFVTLALNLPLRRGQLLAITPDAVDLDNGLLLATSSKGRKSRAIPLNSTVIRTLQTMMRDGNLPFPLKDFRRRWSRITQAAGINKSGGKRGENFTFHDLRKEFASELIRRKANPKTVQHLFAHSDMSITDIYIQEDFEQMREAVNILDSEVIE
jgi:integrase